MVAASLKKTLPAERPFRTAWESDLETQFRRVLTAHDGTVGAHCIHEWWMRNAFPTQIEATLPNYGGKRQGQFPTGCRGTRRT